MIGTLLLAPHADDETLFASYVCQREQPMVVCCFNQGRSNEFQMAVNTLSCQGVTLGMPGTRYSHGDMISHLSLPPYCDAEVVWAPKIEEEGHQDHNLVGQVARDVFGDRVRNYLTYAPRAQRSTDGIEVENVQAYEISAKLRALSWYISQIEDHSTRPWFTTLLDLREWLADVNTVGGGQVGC